MSICCANGESAQKTMPGVGRAPSAIDWIIGRIHEDTQLLRSFDNPAEFNSWTYDQAVGVIALLETGKHREARAVLDAMLKLLAEGKAEEHTRKNAFADGYEWDTGKEIVGAETWATGPNAWMGLALLHAYGALRDPAYLQAAREIAAWLVDTLRIERGKLAAAFRGGIHPADGALETYVSTEHNADMLAFLRGLETFAAVAPQDSRKWGDYATDLEKWMLKPLAEMGLWNEAESRFIVGYQPIDPPAVSSFPELLDSQTWTLLAFDASRRVTGKQRREDRNGLDWLDANVQVAVQCGGETRIGFSKRTFESPESRVLVESYWIEGMAGYALARLLVPLGDPSSQLNARNVINDLRCFQRADGGLLYSAGETIDLSDWFDGGSPPNEFPIATFSGFTNIVGGEPGVFGDAQPDWKNQASRLVSWFYSQQEVGEGSFRQENVRSPPASFALVNDYDRSLRYGRFKGSHGWNDKQSEWTPYGWASFALTLAPKIGSGKPPDSRDISDFSELRFWARANAPGVRIKVAIRDGSGDHFWPSGEGHLVDHEDWEQVRVRLRKLRGVDLKRVHSVGLSFGRMLNDKLFNQDQATLWVDDFSFFPSDQPLPELKVFPDNWAWESVASSGWFIFASRGANPFAVRPATAGESPESPTR